MSMPRPLPPIPDEHRLRTFTVGAAAVEPSDASYGRDPATFSPEEYGHYAATSNAVYAASRIRADNLGKLKVKLYRETRKGEVEVDRGRPGSLFDLCQRVNPFWSMRRMIRMIEWSRCLWGAAFVTLERGAAGRRPPSEMWWVRPDRMRVHPHPTKYIGGYSYEHNGERILFSPGEVLWFPLDNPIDEFAGLSPLAAARLSIDTASAATRANRRAFSNGMSAAGLVTPDKPDETWTQTQTDSVAGLVRKTLVGEENARAIGVWGRSAKFTQFMMSAVDMQYIEQLKWSLADVARAYGVPVNMLQDNEHATLANVKEYDKILWESTLIPEANAISDTLTEFLVPMFPGEADRIALDYSDVASLQEDMTENTAQAQIWFSLGVPLNKLIDVYNPALASEDGQGYPWGDTPKTTMTQVGEDGGIETIPIAGQQNPLAIGPGDRPDTGEDDEDEANEDTPTRAALAIVRRMRHEATEAAQTRAEWGYGGERHLLAMRRFERAVSRNQRALVAGLRSLFARQEESVLARLRKRSVDGVLTRDDDSVADAPFDIEEWTQRTIDALAPILEDILVDGAESALDDHAISAMFDVQNPRVREWLEQRAQRFAQQINETTWKELRSRIADAIDAGASLEDIAAAVKEVMQIASDSRAMTIAQTETVGALNAGSLEAARQAGPDIVTGKRWLSAQDERVRDTHVAAHGQERALEEDFSVGSGSGPAPGQMGVAEEDINCRCTVTWVLAE